MQLIGHCLIPLVPCLSIISSFCSYQSILIFIYSLLIMIHSCNDDSVSFSKTGFSTGISGFSTLSKTGFSDNVTEISAPPSLFDSVVVVVVVVVELLRLWSWFLLVFVTFINNKQVVTYLTYNGTQSFIATLTYSLAQKLWILLLFFL